MPENYKRPLYYKLIAFLLVATIILAASIQASEGIERYYIRYDVQSSTHTIIKDSLLMVPAKNDFRAENFSQIYTTGVISAASYKTTSSVDIQIKEDALKTILVKNGLKSVKAKDNDTVVSYEGIIITPLHIITKAYNETNDNYSYKVKVEFSPLAFPDRWETLEIKNKFKKIFSDFFELFK